MPAPPAPIGKPVQITALMRNTGGSGQLFVLTDSGRLYFAIIGNLGVAEWTEVHGPWG